MKKRKKILTIFGIFFVIIIFGYVFITVNNVQPSNIISSNLETKTNLDNDNPDYIFEEIEDKDGNLKKVKMEKSKGLIEKEEIEFYEISKSSILILGNIYNGYITNINEENLTFLVQKERKNIGRINLKLELEEVESYLINFKLNKYFSERDNLIENRIAINSRRIDRIDELEPLIGIELRMQEGIFLDAATKYRQNSLDFYIK